MSQPHEIWSQICDQLNKTRVGRDVIDRWFAEAAITNCSEKQLEIEFPTPMHVRWIDTYYRGDLERATEKVIGKRLELQLMASQAEEEVEEEEPVAEEETKMVDSRHNGHLSKDRIAQAGLNPKFSFGSFVVGDNSRYCHAVATSVANDPGSRNPLLFFGGTGLGKTHLMSAIGNQVLQNDKNKVVLFVTAEEFTNEYIEAVQKNSLSQFRAKYRGVDVLLIDDIHFVAGKDSTQEEFFHTFNKLVNHHSQVVLTSDRAPSEIPRLEKRLVSRFQMGIAAEVLPPGAETRMAILRKKAEEWGVDIPHDVLEFVATRIRKNVRKLEGALLRLSTYQSLYRGPLTREQSEDYLKDILAEEESNAVVTISEIQKAVASHFDVRLADLSGRRRTSQMVLPRHIAMFLSRELTQSSLKDIGHAFGGRDHGTVINACKKVSKEAIEKPEVHRMIDFLRDKLTH